MSNQYREFVAERSETGTGGALSFYDRDGNAFTPSSAQRLYVTHVYFQTDTETDATVYFGPSNAAGKRLVRGESFKAGSGVATPFRDIHPSGAIGDSINVSLGTSSSYSCIVRGYLGGT